MKQLSRRLPPLSRLSGLLILFILGFGLAMIPGGDPLAGVDRQAVEEDDILFGDDVLHSLSLDGLADQTLTTPNQAPAANAAPATALPSRVDNSTSKYFPGIMQQKGGSCAQASGIHYNFTFEMNLARGLDSRLPENQYPTHWTWNCLNAGTGKGSNYSKGWSLVKEVGVPSLDAYGEKFAHHPEYSWPSGYDVYYAAMKNRVDSHGSLPIKSPSDLERVKGYLFNHNDPNQTVGGLLSYSLNSKGRKYVKVSKGQHEEGKSLIISWGETGAHAMTIVGYDDNVCWDVNGDGKITNDVDLDGDGKITMADWERGAFIWVDSHGARQGDGGKGYSLYRLTQIKKEKGGQTPNGFWVKVKKDYQPRTTLLLKFAFNDRSALQLTAGFAGNSDSDAPTRTVAPGVYNGKYNVGKVTMRGKTNPEPIEIGLDLTDITPSDLSSGRFFVNMSRKAGTTGTGQLLGASILRYDARGAVQSVHNFAIDDGKFGEKAISVSTSVAGLR